MKISVVIPLYNKEKTICRAVNSVLSQKHSDFELIIVDDGSTDGSVKEVEKFHDHRIQLFTQTNQGVSAARNFGVEKASSNWISFLDADDEYEHDFLTRCVDMLHKYDDRRVSFITSDYMRKSNIGNKHKNTYENSSESGETNYFNLCKGHKTPACSSSTLVNKDIFYRVGGFPVGVEYFEDWILWMKLAWHGSFIYIAEPLSNYWKDELGASSPENIKTEEFYRCAMLLIETAHSVFLLNQMGREITKTTMVYANLFLLSKSYYLVRRESYKRAYMLLTRFRIKYFHFSMIPKFISIVAFSIYSVVRKKKRKK